MMNLELTGILIGYCLGLWLSYFLRGKEKTIIYGDEFKKEYEKQIQSMFGVD